MRETCKKAFTFLAVFSVIATPIFPPFGGFADDQNSPSDTVSQIYLPANTTSIQTHSSMGQWNNLSASQNFGSADMDPLENFNRQNSTYLSLSDNNSQTQNSADPPSEPAAPAPAQIIPVTGTTTDASSASGIILTQDEEVAPATDTGLTRLSGADQKEQAADSNASASPANTSSAASSPDIITASTTPGDISGSGTTSPISVPPASDSTPTSPSTSPATIPAQDQQASTTQTFETHPRTVTGPVNGANSPDLEYSGFAAQGSQAMASSTLVDASLKISLAGFQNPGAWVSLDYSYAGSDWQSLGKLDFGGAQSPELNKGYFAFSLPKGAARNFDSLKIKINYHGRQSGTEPALFIKDLWVEADFNLIAPDTFGDDAAPVSPSESSAFFSLDFQNQLLEMTLPGDLSNPITVGRKGSLPFAIALKSVSKASKPQRNGDVIVYPEAFPSTDLQYQLQPGGLKENIILKGADHPKNFRYAVNSDAYDIRQISPNVIDFYKKGHLGQTLYKLYTISAPIMTDALGQTSRQLEFKIKHNSITLTPDAQWLKQASYPVTIDPNVEINILNVSSFPVAGEEWTIDFTTLGTADLTVTPADQDTINDMSFVSLTCGNSAVVPSVDRLTGAVAALNWSCDNDIGEIKFLDNKTGHHHLIFNFGGVTQDAYNGSNTYNGGAGDGKWETAGNWSAGHAPTATDDIVINTAATVNINASSTVNSLTVGNSGGGTLSVLNFNYDAIAGGALTTLGNLTAYASSTITHTAATTTVAGKIRLTVGGNAAITGSINADAKGFYVGQGPGAPPTTSGQYGAGGSYGGIGGTGDGSSPPSTSTYGSLTAPIDLGSGGGRTCGLGANSGTDTGLWGGGAIQLNVTGTTTISGSISANGSGTNSGGLCWVPGGGSGGSVYLTTGVLTGSGTVSVNGGDVNFVAGGGGGRIAVYYSTDNSSVSYQSYGGTYNRSYVAGAGTIYKKAASESYGDVTVDNNNLNGTAWNTFGLTSLATTTLALDSLTVKNSAYLFFTNTVSATATAVTVSGNGALDIRSGTTLNSSSQNYAGGFVLDSGGSFAVFTQNQDITIPSTATLVENSPGNSRTYNNATVNGTLTSGYNDTATSGTASLNMVNWIINGNLTVAVGGSVSVLAKGFVANTGPSPGSVVSSVGGGGSYGGLGGNSLHCCNFVAGLGGTTTYGSLTAPASLGSGGGSPNPIANRGGGAIQLTVSATTTLNGSLVSDGATTANNNDGAGAGGSIYLTTVGLTGNGSFSAKGGTGSWTGGGGGGRVGVYYTNDASSVTYSASGGTATPGNNGSPGTIFKKNPGQSFGDLIIDGNNIGGSVDTAIPLTAIASATLDSITLQNSGAIYLTASSATTTTLNLINNGFYDAQAGTRLNYSTLNITTSAIVRDSGGGFPMIDQNQDMTVPANLQLLMNVPGASRTYNNVTINGTLTTSYNNSATSSTPASGLYKINWQVNGNLVINSGGTVNVDARGFIQGNGAGAGTPTSGAGGSYGGLGGTASYSFSTTVAATYGSVTAPTDLGSGGSSGNCSSNTEGNGGGAVQFTVSGNISINGTISANGGGSTSNCGSPQGGGSGGSIYLTGAAYSGTGSLSAIGGDSISSGCCGNKGGGGGGGRVAVSFTSNTNNAVSRSVSGGYLSQPAQAGATGTLSPPDQPVVTTQDPINIADTSVMGEGTLTQLNYYPVTQHGNVIGTSSNPTLANAVAISTLGNMSATGTFAGLVMGLTHDTNYHIRSYATTAGGTAYGNDVTFITDAPAILTQIDYRFYKNVNQLQPATSLAGQDAPASIYTTTTPIRLVMNMSATTDFLPAGVGQFKLQVSTATTTGWADISPTGGAWWNTGWLNRRKIIFNNASSTTDLINFPVLVALNATSSNNIDYTKTKTAGADIRFVASDNTTSLPYEIEKWDASATSTIWVKAPNIHAASTTDFIYVYYNNSLASDGQSATNTWDSYYGGVWHLPNGTSLTASDSTAHLNNGSINGAETAFAGQIDGAATSSGASNYIDLGSNSSIQPTASGTVSIWVKPSAFVNYHTAIGDDDLNNGRNGWAIFVPATGKAGVEFDSASSFKDLSDTVSLSLNTWANLTVAWDSVQNFMTLYKNGQFAASTTLTVIPTAGTYSTKLGIDGVKSAANFYWAGGLDEARISSLARSADWILAEYKTDTGQMNSYAAEESMSAVTLPPGFAFYSNAGIASGTTVAALLLSTSNVQETYEQSNPTAITPNQISVGQSGEWDFSVNPANAVVNTTYYFRMVKSDGTALDFYNNYPAVTLLPDNAPNAPTSLGPASVVGGGYATTSAPAFSFSLSDPDATDTVQFDLQISTTSDFTGLVVDYTSALQNQGPGAYTVGQAAGGGTYNVGSASTRLADSSSGYYWRVQAVDLHGVTSQNAVANGGSVAFKVDTVAPNTGILSVATTSVTSLTASVSGASDITSGLAATPYIFNNVTKGTNSAATSSLSWLSSGLTINTQYTFNVQVSDAVGNAATGSNVSVYTLANPPTSLATTSAAQTSISLSWDNNSDPFGTNFVLENITAGTSATTTATSTTYSSLACGTSYSFRVKALNGDNISTANSSTVSQSTSVCNNPPNVPSSLGPSGVVGGGTITSSAPGFSFTLSDPDIADTLKYEIQISTASDFSALVVDYTSALSAQGSLSFTLGQGAGSGLYSTGFSGQTLADGSYYWRVKAVDNSALSSAYVTANGAAVAFTVSAGSAVSGGSSGGGGGGNGISVNPYSSPPAQAPPSGQTFLGLTIPQALVSLVPSIVPVNPTRPNLAPNHTPPFSETLPGPEPIGSFGSRQAGGASQGPNWKNSLLSYQSAVSAFLDEFVERFGNSFPFYFGKNPLAAAKMFTAAAALGLAAISAQGILISQGLLWTLAGLTDVWWLLLRQLYGLLTIFGLRKKRRRWGTVYDSQTKQPLDPAIVELVEVGSGKIVEQCITDLTGRFGFLDRPGKFTISAKKTHYAFPSKIAAGKHDGIYDHLYHGEVIIIQSASSVLTPNVPMDQLAFDWNQQDKLRLVKIHPKLEYSLYLGLNILFWAGAIYSFLAFSASPGLFTGLLLAFYALLIAAKVLLPGKKLWGRISSKTVMVSGLLLEISPVALPQIILGRTVTAAAGKFFLKGPAGMYILKVSDPATKRIIAIVKTRIADEGVLNLTINI